MSYVARLYSGILQVFIFQSLFLFLPCSRYHMCLRLWRLHYAYCRNPRHTRFQTPLLSSAVILNITSVRVILYLIFQVFHSRLLCSPLAFTSAYNFTTRYSSALPPFGTMYCISELGNVGWLSVSWQSLFECYFRHIGSSLTLVTGRTLGDLGSSHIPPSLYGRVQFWLSAPTCCERCPRLSEIVFSALFYYR